MLDQQLEQHSPGGGGGSKSFLEILISLSHFRLPQEFSVYIYIFFNLLCIICIMTINHFVE